MLENHPIVLLFVYGTLRYGFELNHLLRNSPFIGLGYVEGFKMYDLGGYPGCVKGDGTIWGEVYQVSEELLRKLDEVEGYSGTPDDLYERTSVTVNFDQKRKYKLSGVQMYVYRRSIDDNMSSGKETSLPIWVCLRYLITSPTLRIPTQK